MIRILFLAPCENRPRADGALETEDIYCKPDDIQFKKKGLITNVYNKAFQTRVLLSVADGVTVMAFPHLVLRLVDGRSMADSYNLKGRVTFTASHAADQFSLKCLIITPLESVISID